MKFTASFSGCGSSDEPSHPPITRSVSGGTTTRLETWAKSQIVNSQVHGLPRRGRIVVALGFFFFG